MNENERDTHFQGYADLLFPELSRLFFTLYARISELRPIEEIDAVEDEIKALLAQRGFDLAWHNVKNIGNTHAPLELRSLSIFEMMDDHTTDVVNDIPDLTAWPEYGEQS